MNKTSVFQTLALAEALEARRLLSAGDLDISFGDSGVRDVTLGTLRSPQRILQQQDGKLLVIGGSDVHVQGPITAYRYNADGSPDASFGAGGAVAITGPAATTLVTDAALLGNGKVLLVAQARGAGRVGDDDVLVTRLNANGSLDLSFGNGGMVQTDIGGAVRGDTPWGIVALPDGRFYVGGITDGGGSYFVLRYTAAGALDPSFGGDGIATAGGQPVGVSRFVVGDDGKPVIASADNGIKGGGSVVYRFTTNGAPDTSFSGDGRQYMEGFSMDQMLAVGEKLLFARGRGGSISFLRLRRDGGIDNGFGPNGRQEFTRADYRFTLRHGFAQQADGNLLLSGYTQDAQGSFDGFVARFTPAAQPDTTFGSGGLVTLNRGESFETLETVTPLIDGRIMAGGSVSTLPTGNAFPILVRLLGDDSAPNDPTTPAIAIEGGVLVARGTGEADTFSIRRHLTDNVIVTVNSLSREFDMDDFFGVRLEGLGGSDTFRLVDALVSPVVRNTTVIGGSGNDRLVYSTRTAPLHFRIDPVAPTSTVTSGVQVDHFVAVETLVGGSGNDSFHLAQEEPTYDPAVSFRLEGRDGNDVFVDSIYPSSNAYGFVTMLGGAGDDRFSDESDMRFTREVFFGEAGNDSVGKYRSAGTFDGGSGIDTLNFRSGSGNLGNFPGFENATATWGGDSDAPISLTGTDGPNHLSIDGSGTINGLDGNDTIVGSEEDDTLNGGGGDDLILGIWGNDELDGGPGTDAADGGVGDDTITNAEIVPGIGRIRIANRVLTAEGTWGGDLITIERVGIDNVIVRIDGFAREFDMDDFDGVLLKGGAGYDQITVLDSLLTPVERKVTLEGGDGNDILDGHDGNDVLRGGNGNDQIRGGAGRNALFGDAGDDFLSASGAALPTFMDGGAGNDFLYADNGIKDTVLGGPGDDDEATVDTLDETLGIEHLLVR